MTPRFSIIVPVFNAEKYLERCLNSISIQTCKDFEVIVVDDGSSDNSKTIYDAFKNTDSRFRLFFIDHGGVSRARNEGLKWAVGDYVCFVDADDQIAPTYLEDLYLALDNDVDSSMGGFKRIDSLSHEECEVVPQKKKESLEENLLGFYAANSKDWQRYMVNRMFKKSIIQNHDIRFKEDIYYKEDGLFLVQYLCASNGRVGCVDKVLYFYYRNSTGAMSKTWHAFDEKILTNLEAHRQMIKILTRRLKSNDVLARAKSQIKSTSNWILKLMAETNSFNLSRIVKIESIMLSALGFADYFSWRFCQFSRLLKKICIK